MSATPQEIKAAIANEKPGQAKKAPRSACTLSFVAGDFRGEAMTEERARKVWTSALVEFLKYIK